MSESFKGIRLLYSKYRSFYAGYSRVELSRLHINVVAEMYKWIQFFLPTQNSFLETEIRVQAVQYRYIHAANLYKYDHYQTRHCERRNLKFFRSQRHNCPSVARRCASKNPKTASWMPSAELIRTWTSDKNNCTAHANITPRLQHDINAKCFVTLYFYFTFTRLSRCQRDKQIYEVK